PYKLGFIGDSDTHNAAGAFQEFDYTGKFENTIGDPELRVFWVDPEFDRDAHTFYYARIIEIPTARWSTFDAIALGITPPAELPLTIQERAFTSPIWYTP
ncbi:MAG: DUF3604 domain-containing protein, partial [Pseudomonadales bacterium]